MAEEIEKNLQDAFKLPVKVRWIDEQAKVEAYQRLINAVNTPEGNDDE